MLCVLRSRDSYTDPAYASFLRVLRVNKLTNTLPMSRRNLIQYFNTISLCFRCPLDDRPRQVASGRSGHKEHDDDDDNRGVSIFVDHGDRVVDEPPPPPPAIFCLSSVKVTFTITLTTTNQQICHPSKLCTKTFCRSQ